MCACLSFLGAGRRLPPSVVCFSDTAAYSEALAMSIAHRVWGGGIYLPTSIISAARYTSPGDMRRLSRLKTAPNWGGEGAVSRRIAWGSRFASRPERFLSRETRQANAPSMYCIHLFVHSFICFFLSFFPFRQPAPPLGVFPVYLSQSGIPGVSESAIPARPHERRAGSPAPSCRCSSSCGYHRDPGIGIKESPR
ncbi:hypothetical protein LX32DRAFT_283589 [Colletotrichum zoysiae]|uniref:Uncharacterized protein n=1 Tax=Colletotrichum zoysiae TaxID=1216348 RepID=A0AAD9HNL2_9PEZI|nr:hypothetical protein LX32DRAFT_283589 [Colletotrichum zoysiae]